MIWIYASVLASSASVSADPVAVFIEACVKGEARIPAGSAKVSTTADRTKVTKRLQFGKPPLDLTIVNHSNSKLTGIEAVCSVRARKVDFYDAVRRIQPFLFGRPEGLPFSSGVQRYSSFIPAGRYRVDVWREGNFVSMRTTMLDPETAARELAKLNSQTDTKRK